MDHLGIDKFMVMGFCIGGPFIWSLLKRAPNRIAGAVLGTASGLASGDARPYVPGRILEGLACADYRQEARNYDADGRAACDQDVRDQS
jgi:pimeloyl-ACP methyl ester carboxylesterase